MHIHAGGGGVTVLTLLLKCLLPESLQAVGCVVCKFTIALARISHAPQCCMIRSGKAYIIGFTNSSLTLAIQVSISHDISTRPYYSRSGDAMGHGCTALPTHPCN